MTIALSDNTPRISYSVNQGATQTSFAVPFVFFNGSSDLNVYVDNTSRSYHASTANTTQYTVTGGNGATGSITTSVTGATGGSTVVITRGVPLSRTTDFPSSGAFEVSKLNTELDTLLTLITDADDENTRALRLQDSDDAVSLTLPLKDARKGTVLGFNASTGAAEAGPTIANVSTLSAITANINTVGGIASNVTTVAGIASNVTTVAGISSNVTTVAGMSSNISTVVTNISAIQGASGNATKAQNWATKIDGEAETGQGYSSKAWATGGTGVTDSSGAGSSKQWATDTDSTVDGTEFSAKEYAVGTTQAVGSSKQWAVGGGSFSTSTVVAGGLYSAKYYAEQAQTASASASGSLSTFQAIWQGSGSSDPTGGTVSDGDLFYNTSTNQLKVYNSGWQVAAVDSSSVATQGQALAFAIAL